jgi:hypothetical protein
VKAADIHAKLEVFWLHKERLILFSIVVLAFWLRLRGISSTPTDWHAFRQADTASVTREYVKHGIDLLHPTYQDHSNTQSGKDNPHGYRMVEFPFINAGIALIIRTFPQLDLVTVSRLVSAVFSLGTVGALYFLVKDLSGRRVATLAAIVFAILPYSVFYSRAILPEPAFVFFTTFAIMSFARWTRRSHWGWYLGSLLALALALLLKPFGLFLGPVFAVLALQAFGWKVILRPELYLYPILAVFPLYGWRKWIAQFPEGIPASDWLFNSNHIRLRPAWFRWLFYERLNKLILGWVGIPVFSLGFLKRGKDWWVYLAWGVGLLAYLIVLATGNVQHDYYQVITTPFVSILVARGLVWILDLPWWRQRTFVQLGLALVILAAIYRVSWYYVHGYYGTRADWEQAGQAVDRLTPPDALVIAPAFSDTGFLFQTNRTGWTLEGEIDKKIAQGATYYISTSYDDEARSLEKKYTLIEKTPVYILIKLVPKQ